MSWCCLSNQTEKNDVLILEKKDEEKCVLLSLKSGIGEQAKSQISVIKRVSDVCEFVL